MIKIPIIAIPLRKSSEVILSENWVGVILIIMVLLSGSLV